MNYLLPLHSVESLPNRYSAL